MKTVFGEVRNGQIVIPSLLDWPDGTPVAVNPVGVNGEIENEKVGMDESEWRDDDQARADWAAWIKTLEPLEYTPEEARELEEWQAKMKAFNIEQVRKQFEEEPLP